PDALPGRHQFPDHRDRTGIQRPSRPLLPAHGRTVRDGHAAGQAAGRRRDGHLGILDELSLPGAAAARVPPCRAVLRRKPRYPRRVSSRETAAQCGVGGMGRDGRSHRRAGERRPGQPIRGPSLPAPRREDHRRLPLGLVALWHHQRVRKDEGAATTSAELRAHNLARLLRAVHAGGGQLTRAELTRQLSLARGTATVLVRELAGRQLIEELASPADAPADIKVPRTRGRPTGVPSAHPQGPVALAVDLRDDSFTVAAFELTGRSTVLDREERDAGSGTGMLTDVADRLRIRGPQFG